MFVDDAGGRGGEKSAESETTGLLKPSDAGGNLPRSPSSEAVQKVNLHESRLLLCTTVNVLQTTVAARRDRLAT